jgi:hypothetical protein
VPSTVVSRPAARSAPPPSRDPLVLSSNTQPATTAVDVPNTYTAPPPRSPAALPWNRLPVTTSAESRTHNAPPAEVATDPVNEQPATGQGAPAVHRRRPAPTQRGAAHEARRQQREVAGDAERAPGGPAGTVLERGALRDHPLARVDARDAAAATFGARVPHRDVVQQEAPGQHQHAPPDAPAVHHQVPQHHHPAGRRDGDRAGARVRVHLDRRELAADRQRVQRGGGRGGVRRARRGQDHLVARGRSVHGVGQGGVPAARSAFSSSRTFPAIFAREERSSSGRRPTVWGWGLRSRTPYSFAGSGR